MKAPCSVCGRVLQLKGNGMIRFHLAAGHHHSFQAYTDFMPNTPRFCAGSGNPAKATP